ncbi:MAG: hypothetical protein ACTSR3_14975 [Candidatus Helarchaeota archaeon]
MSSTIKLSDELIRNWVNSVSRQDIKELIKKWGFKIENEHLSKFEIFKKAIGNKLSNEQFQKFWLLKEKNAIKNRNWALYRYDSSKIKDLQDLDKFKNSLIEVLKEELKIKVEFAILLDRFDDLGVYLVFDFKGSPKIIEDFGFKFHLFHSIRRVRCLLGSNDYIQISGVSKNIEKLCLKALEKVLDLKIQVVPIYSYAVRDFIQQMKPIQKLVVVCPREMGGFSGVERITVEGPNVVEGMEDLRSRQEILFNFEGLSKLGAWTVVKSKSAKIDVHGKIKLGDKDTEGKVLYFLRE